MDWIYPRGSIIARLSGTPGEALSSYHRLEDILGYYCSIDSFKKNSCHVFH